MSQTKIQLPKETKTRINKVTQEDIDRAIVDNRYFAKLLRDNKGFIESIVIKFIQIRDDRFEEYYWHGAHAFYIALQKFNAKKKGASSLSTYAYKVIKNYIIRKMTMEYKKTCKETSLEVFKASQENENSGYNESSWNLKPVSIEDVVVNSIAKEQFMAAFSPIERQILELRIQNYTMKEIAKKLNKNIPTLRMIYYNAVNKPEYKMLFAEIQD
jgi:RNA polymerase sigma factor (sigma-70 family)